MNSFLFPLALALGAVLSGMKIYPLGGHSVMEHTRLQLWSPEDIVTLAHWDTSDTDSITDTGGLADQIDDKSGNSRHLLGTGASRPTTNSRTLNGLNVMDCGGSQFMSFSVLPVDPDGDLRIFTVAGIDFCDNNADSIMSLNGSAPDFNFLSDDAGGPDFNGGINGGFGPNIDFSPIPNNGPSIYFIDFDFNGSGLVRGFVDGSIRGSGSYDNPLTSGTQDFAMFSNRGFGQMPDGFFAETLATRDMTLDTQYKIEGYLAHKWFGAGALNNLPINHPHKNFPPLVGVLSVLIPIFADTFNRSDNTDLNVSDVGKSGGLGALDWVKVTSGASGKAEIDSNELKMGDDTGGSGDWAIAYVDHNFIDSLITDDGEFSISVDLSAAGFGGATRNVGFGIGHSKAELDAWSSNNPTSFDSDFFIGYDPTGTKEVKIWIDGGTQDHQEGINLDSGGTLRVRFSNITDFNATTTITYEAFIDDVLIKTGTFDWSGTNENYITTFSNISSQGGLLDSFNVTVSELWTAANMTTRLWYDFSDTANADNIIVSNDVSQWGDKSGNDDHITQGTASREPRSGIDTISGLDVLSTTDDEFLQAVIATANNQGHDIYIVRQHDDTGTGQACVLDDTGGTGEFRDDSGFGSWQRNDANDIQDQADTIDTDLHLHNVKYTGANTQIFKDGIQVGLDEVMTGNMTLNIIKLNTNVFGAANSGVDAKFCEVVYIDSNATADEKLRLEGYLAHKWGFESELDGGHPYKTKAPTI